MSYAVQRVYISSDVFDDIMYTHRAKVEIVSDLQPYLKDLSWVDRDHLKIYYNKTNETAIGYYLILIGRGICPVRRAYMRRCVFVRSDARVENEFYEQPFPQQCAAYVKKLLYGAGYTDETIDQALKEHSIDYHVSPLHKSDPWADGTPVNYGMDEIHCWDNCVYYDINNAHMDALCEIFPLAKKKFHALRVKINKLKKAGKKNEAQRLKDFINIFCGMLGKTIKDEKGKVTGVVETRGTYEWIVQRTRNILQSAIDYCGGRVLYANTDGVMIHAPDRTLETSDKLGCFKSELSDTCGRVYYFQHAAVKGQSTAYRVYQYVNSKGEKEIKGNAPHKVRSQMDLSQQKIVTYLQIEDQGCRDYINIEQQTREVKYHAK